MKDCKTIRPLLSEYVDGTLDNETTWQVKLHVTTCAVCAQVVADFEGTARLLSALPKAEPSANFEAMLAKRLADQVLKPQPTSAWERLCHRVSEWWMLPASRPVLATGAALAVLVPVAVVTQRVVPSLVPSPAPVASVAPAEGDTLEQLWREHTAYASSEPLGDRSELISTTTLDTF